MSSRRYGCWPSPLSAQALVAGARGFSELCVDAGRLFWIESRPDEGGRNLAMCRQPSGRIEALTDANHNLRSRVHEYGGGALCAAGGALFFTHFADQRLYRLAPGDGAPRPLTPEGPQRYADAALDAARARLICVQEDHAGPGEPHNRLVAVDLAGDAPVRPLFDGADFVAAPCVSPDGTRIAFLAWDHPNMPWDDVALYVAELGACGALEHLRRIEPHRSEALIEPRFAPDGRLYVISDRDDWWNLYRVEDDRLQAVTRQTLELGRPAWVLHDGLYDFLADGRIAVLTNDRGREGLALVDVQTGAVQHVEVGLQESGSLATDGERIYLVAGFADRAGGIVSIDPRDGSLTMVREAQASILPADHVSHAETVCFPTSDGEQAHGFFYAPRHADIEPLQDERPPLLVLVHGGPTSHTTASFSARIQFWTTRGFAVLDLNYRGSTGFGRRYRRSLYGHWGEKDVADAVHGARFLAGQGRVDAARLLIRGGSAGGFTVLAAHAFHDVFASGANYYGVSDMEALARDTHKFESRYLDQLVGPYPQAQAIYRARSPIHRLEGFRKPLIVLQGLEDRIVPPNQSQAIVDALRARGVPVAYVAFAGEQHGFRSADNIVSAIQAELYFYGRVLGFTPADALPAIDIHHLP